MASEGQPRLATRSFRIEVVGGPDKGVRFQAERERTVVGTHPSADLVLRDRTISRFHFEIVVDAERATLRDLGSRNGTRVDGVRVHHAELDGKQTITLGETRLRFLLGDPVLAIPLSTRERFGRLVGRSQTMKAIYPWLEAASASEATVLLEGETGCGKDVAAESIHQESARKDGPFVVVDCGAIPDNLLESELFGHDKGAFTGADRARTGAFELAHGGTLFLNEVGELGPDLQPKLLRVLESRQVKRVGANVLRPVDVRIVAATPVSYTHLTLPTILRV